MVALRFDAPNLVPCAGLLPVAERAQRLGLALVDERPRLQRLGASCLPRRSPAALLGGAIAADL